METKKIILTTNNLSAVGMWGGIGSYVHDLAQSLSERGHIVYVYLYRIKNEVIIQTGIKYKYRLFIIPSERIDEHLVVNESLRAIEEIKPNVIINNEVSYISGLWPIIDKEIIRISIVHGITTDLTFKNFITSRFPQLNVFGIPSKISILNWQYIDSIICQNENFRISLSKRFSIPINKIVCIHQTSFSNQISTRNENLFTIIYGANKRRLKGYKIAIKLAKKLTESNLNFKFIFCVSPDHKLVKLINDNRIEFTGTLPRNEFLNKLSSADVIVIPSKRETGPLLLVEAMSFGVIPICYKTPSASIDIIKNGINGYIVSQDNFQSFLEILKKLIVSDNTDIRNNSLEYFNQHLHPARFIDNIEYLFKRKVNLPNRREINDKDIIFTHIRPTSEYPIYSYIRLISKIMSVFCIIITAKNYRWVKFLLK